MMAASITPTWSEVRPARPARAYSSGVMMILMPGKGDSANAALAVRRSRARRVFMGGGGEGEPRAYDPEPDNGCHSVGAQSKSGFEKFLGAGLGRNEAGENPAALDELAVATLLDDAALLQHDDAIGVLDRAQAVGDGDDGAPRGEALQRLLDQPLALVVEGRRGLVA